MLGSPSSKTSNHPPIHAQHTVQIPSIKRHSPTLVIWAIIGFSHKETTLFITSSVKQEGRLHEKFLLHFLIKARPGRWAIAQTENRLPAPPFPRAGSVRDSCSPAPHPGEPLHSRQLALNMKAKPENLTPACSSVLPASTAAWTTCVGRKAPRCQRSFIFYRPLSPSYWSFRLHEHFLFPPVGWQDCLTVSALAYRNLPVFSL